MQEFNRDTRGLIFLDATVVAKHFCIMRQENWIMQAVFPLEMSNMRPVQPLPMQRWKSPMTP